MNRLFLIGSVACASLAIAASAEAAVLVDQNFDSYIDGYTVASGNAIGGGVVGYSGSATASVTNSQSVSPSNSLKLVDATDTTQSYHPYIRWGIPGQSNDIVQISFDYRFTSTTNPGFYVNVKGTTVRARLLFTQTALQASTDGNAGANIGSISQDTWYHIVMQVPTFDNVSATGFTVKLDNTTYTNQALWAGSNTHSTDTISSIEFMDDGKNVDTIYLDNVNVQTMPVPEPAVMSLLLALGVGLLGRRKRR